MLCLTFTIRRKQYSVVKTWSLTFLEIQESTFQNFWKISNILGCRCGRSYTSLKTTCLSNKCCQKALAIYKHLLAHRVNEILLNKCDVSQYKSDIENKIKHERYQHMIIITRGTC